MATHSEASWPPVPIHCGQSFRFNLATPWVIEAALDNPLQGHLLRVHQRETGRRFSWLLLKAKARPLVYAWLPLRLRLFLRRLLP